MRFHTVLAAALVAAVTCPAVSVAQSRGGEVRLGVQQHDVLHPDTLESGANLQLQVLGSPIPRVRFLGTPRPVLAVSGNTDGETSYASIGLAFDRQFSDRVKGELQFGYAIHDGVVEAENDAEREARLQLGSRDLFRVSLALDYALDARWSVGIQWDHLSHGQILGQGLNQGMDSAGVRIGRKF